jgi:putative acetyltransferase
MSFTPEEVTLRDGRVATLRLATVADAAALVALERVVVRARAGVVKHDDEVAPDAEAFVRRAGPSLVGAENADGRSFRLVAEVGGALVGDVVFTRMPFRMLRHVALVGLGVHPDAQGVGLGRALMASALAHARALRDADGARITRVELYVRADNARARALYEALGFVTEGARRAFLRDDDGTYVDDLVMGLLFEG